MTVVIHVDLHALITVFLPPTHPLNRVERHVYIVLSVFVDGWMSCSISVLLITAGWSLMKFFKPTY